MLAAEDADVVPVVRDGELHPEAGPAVGVGLQQLGGLGLVQSHPRAQAQAVAQGGVHEPSVHVGKPVQVGDHVRVDHRHHVGVLVRAGTGHGVLEVVLAAGGVQLLGNVLGDRFQGDRLG